MIENKNNVSLDMAEIYRQNYQDALDEIRQLKHKIAKLEREVAEFERKEKSRDSYSSWTPSRPLTVDEYDIFYK